MKGRDSGMPDEALWESFFDPACVVGRLDCWGSSGNVVEFGCGYGTFTTPAASRVPGIVLALDIDEGMVAATSGRALRAGLSNVVVERRDFVADGCGLPDASAGYAMLFNILHIEDPVALLGEARRALAPGGKAGIIHWRNDVDTPRGPALAIRPTPGQCRAWGEAAGLEFVRHEALGCCPWHWGMVMRRPVAADGR